MNYCGLKKFDIANGTGTRVSLFVSGCTNNCEGCFQPETQKFDYGVPFTNEVEEEIIEALEPYYIHGLSLLGGEPFEPANQRVLVPFLERVRERYPSKDIWVYSGFRYSDELTVPGSHPYCEVTDRFLELIDILVDGRFEISQKDITLKFRGSRNQCIIDMKRTREAGEVILWDDSRASE